MFGSWKESKLLRLESAGNVVIGIYKEKCTVNVVTMAATYCSSSWNDKELLALDMIENIVDYDFFSTKAHITICLLSLHFLIFVFQYKLNNLRNCNFKEQMRLIFAS